MKSLTLAVPTWNNPNQLIPALVSLCRNTDFIGQLIVVNNGDPRIGNRSYQKFVQASVPKDIHWIEAGRNLGWMGGINKALKEATGDYFCMCNDDVLFPTNRYFWQTAVGYFEMGHFLEAVENKFNKLGRSLNIGGVGVCSNYVAGYQNLGLQGMPDVFLAPLLIGLCAVYPTALLRELGGLDESLPGGDDFDISIRMREAGYNLVVDRRLYLHHLGAQTGRRVKPDWDSLEHQTATSNALIRKHGVSKWYECMNGSILELHGAWSIGEQDAFRGSAKSQARQCGMPNVDAEGLYVRAITERSDVSDHLPVLMELAKTCKHVVEFGTDDCTTAVALLQAKPVALTCVDIKRHENVTLLEQGANGTQFRFIQASTLDIELPPCDLLYIDDLHTGEHVRQELQKHGMQVHKYIAFHDTETCKDFGEDGKEGIMPPILEFLRDHDEWRILRHVPYNNGFTVLVRTA